MFCGGTLTYPLPEKADYLLAGSPLISVSPRLLTRLIGSLSGLSIRIDRNFSAAQEPNPSLTDECRFRFTPRGISAAGPFGFSFFRSTTAANSRSIPLFQAASCTPTSPLLLFLLLSLWQSKITLLQIFRHSVIWECRIRFHLK